MDSDALGGHIKGTHKMKEKVYKEQYCVYKQKPLTPRSSENEVRRTSILKRKPSEDMQEELARPIKKFKSKDDVVRNDRVSMELEQDGSNVSEGSEGRRIGPPGNERALPQVLGPDQKRREILKKRFEMKNFVDEEEVEVALVAGEEAIIETERRPMSERISRISRSKKSRRVQDDMSETVAMSNSSEKESVAPPAIEGGQTTGEEESGESEEVVNQMTKMERVGKVTNKRVGALKKESRIFEESVLGNYGNQVLGKSDRAKPPEKNKLSSLNYTDERSNRARLRLRKRWKKARDVFDPFVDVEYDCNLKDCQDCGKV